MRWIAGSFLWAMMICLSMSYVAQGQSENSAEHAKRQFIESVNRDLDRLSSELQGKEKGHMSFGANLVFAHGAFIKGFPAEALLKYVDALKESGAHRIEINPAIDPWVDGDAATIRKYDALVEHIHRSGLQLAINPEFVRKEDRAFDFKTWAASALQVYSEISRRYRPDIFVVVHEPAIMAARMGQEVAPGQWSKFADSAIRSVKESSPSTKCGVGVLFNEGAYLDQFLLLKGLDTVSVDIYSISDLSAYDSLISAAKKKGKTVYIEETWRPAYVEDNSGPKEKLETSASQGVGDHDFMKVDIKWLETMSLYSSVRGLESITPFWTQTFFLYVKQGDSDGRGTAYNSRVVAAIERGERTDTFHAFERLTGVFAGPPRRPE